MKTVYLFNLTHFKIHSETFMDFLFDELNPVTHSNALNFITSVSSNYIDDVISRADNHAKL